MNWPFKKKKNWTIKKKSEDKKKNTSKSIPQNITLNLCVTSFVLDVGVDWSWESSNFLEFGWAGWRGRRRPSDPPPTVFNYNTKIWLHHAPSPPTLGSRVKPLGLFGLSRRLSAHPRGRRGGGGLCVCLGGGWWIPMLAWWLGEELAQPGGSVPVCFLLFLKGVMWLYEWF